MCLYSLLESKLASLADLILLPAVNLICCIRTGYCYGGRTDDTADACYCGGIVLNLSASFPRAALHTAVTGIVIERPTDADVKATSTESGCDSAHYGGKDGHYQGYDLPPRSL